MRTIITLAILLGTVGAASAQQAAPVEFSGNCKDYAASKEVCVATNWCRWTVRKDVALPNGKTFTPPAVCGFKQNHKAGWEAAKAQ